MFYNMIGNTVQRAENSQGKRRSVKWSSVMVCFYRVFIEKLKMRHLELPPSQRDFDCDVKSECSIDIKDEDLEALDIKEDFMELPLDVTLESDNDINSVEKRSDFLPTESDDENELFTSHEEINLSPQNSSNSSQSSVKLKNRRKNAQPQKAVQEFSNSASNSSNSNFTLERFSKEEEEDEESGDIEADIFKGLKEETGEEFDEEMQRSVKEEWKAHWGVKCNMCEKVFTFKSQFDKHYRTNYNADPMYTCSYCDKTMDKYTTFRSHCYRHITEGRYRCYKCNKGFSLESMLHDHVIAKHTEVKPFICEECGKGFVTKPGLKIHLKKHKTGEKEDYPCVECGKILHTRGGLTAHLTVHRLGRRFMCDICGKTFTQKVNMQQHVKHHSGERPHTCPQCGKRFAERSHLARHRSFHSDTRPFQCSICNKCYKTERCLKVHGLVHQEERKYGCEYCGKGFLSSTKLKQHLNIHTGQRPFKCKYCERTFTNYPNWLKHTRRRHKVDHRTGLDLVPKQEAMTPAPPPEPEPEITAAEVGAAPDLGSYMLDYTLDRTDESVLSAELTQLANERIIAQQHMAVDFDNGVASAHPVGLIVPCYTQEQISEHYLPHSGLLEVQPPLVPQPFPDQLLHSQLMQQHMLHM